MKRGREEARQLGLEGKSVRDIAQIIGASTSSVSLWVRDIELTEEQKDKLKESQHRWAGQNLGDQANRIKSRELRSSYQQAGRAKAREGRPLHLAGCMLYWAEGAKDKNRLYFVNSDSNMMVLFMRFLREEMGITDTDVKLYINCHTLEPQEQRRIEGYWLNLLGLLASCHKQTFFKKGSEVRHRVLENGVCTVRVYKSEIVQHIFGAIQEYGGFENPEWLF